VPPREVALNRRLSTLASTKLANPIVRRLLERGLMPRTHALLETTGRKSGEPRRTPVGNGLRGDTFWIVTEHGRESNYVKNIEANPRVRVKVGRKWRDGTAHLLPEDDVRARMKELRRPGNDTLVRLAGSSLMTVRIDLDPSTPGATRAS
jgi:deazaflavin-dependent oxidoreductase (nitroreductase family)